MRHAAVALFVLASGMVQGCQRFGYDPRRLPLAAAGDGGAGMDAGPMGGMDGGAEVGAGRGASSGGTGGLGGSSGAGAGSDDLDGGTERDGAAPDACVDGPLPLPPTPSGPLIHRYSFASGGSTACGPCVADEQCAEDSVGGAHGVLHVATLTTDGAVQFTGQSWVLMEPPSGGDYVDQPNPEYVELPPGILAGLTAVTFIVWYEWTGPLQGSFEHPRLFHFGSDTASDPNDADAFIYATPAADTSNGVRASIDNGYVDPANKNNRLGRWTVDLGSRAQGTAYCLGVAFADATHTLVAALGGVTSSQVTMTTTTPLPSKVVYNLADVLDDHNWIGRSPIAVDAPFIGTIREFRIYDTALTPSEIDNLCQDPDAP